MGDALVDGLGRLRDALVGADLSLPLPLADAAADTRDEAVSQVEDYLLPRLARVDAPLLAVLGGSTGSGKSTLANSLVGEEVSQAGVLRPTTRAPVLVCHPADRAWFAGDGVLPDLPRTTGTRGEGHALHLVTSDRLPQGLGLLDSPDIDSIEVANHDLATQLLGAADLWLFTTTAARYADAVPWRYLARASERGAAVALVVNRIPPTPGAAEAIAADVRRLLDDGGLASARLFTVEEVPLVEGRLGGAEAPLGDWIRDLVADAGRRAAVIRTTVAGAVASLPARVERVAAAVDEQAAAVAALRAVADAQARGTADRVADQLGGGTLLRGEVLDRFRDEVGTAEWMHRLQRGVGRVRDRLRSLVTGRSVPVEEVRGQLQDNLAVVVEDAVIAGVEGTVATWRQLPGGTAVLDGAGDPAAAVSRQAVAEAIARWQDGVVAMVRQQAAGKLSMARGLSVGVNGIGVSLMVVVFASTGGLTGGEVAVAGGTAAVSQAVLTAVFGEQAVRDLALRARTDLLQHVTGLAAEAHRPLLARLDGIGAGAQDLRAAAAAVAGAAA